MARPLPLPAQHAPRVALEAVVVRASVSGGDFYDTDAGFGWDGQLRLGVWGVSVGVGYGETMHHNDQLGRSLTASSWFIEPRYTLHIRSLGLATYLAMRYARSELSLNTYLPGFGPVDASQDGHLLLAGPGLSIPVMPRLHMELALLYGTATFVTATVNGQPLPNSQRDGKMLQVRAGLSWGSRRR